VSEIKLELAAEQVDTILSFLNDKFKSFPNLRNFFWDKFVFPDNPLFTVEKACDNLEVTRVILYFSPTKEFLAFLFEMELFNKDDMEILYNFFGHYVTESFMPKIPQKKPES